MQVPQPSLEVVSGQGRASSGPLREREPACDLWPRRDPKSCRGTTSAPALRPTSPCPADREATHPDRDLQAVSVSSMGSVLEDSTPHPLPRHNELPRCWCQLSPADWPWQGATLQRHDRLCVLRFFSSTSNIGWWRCVRRHNIAYWRKPRLLRISICYRGSQNKLPLWSAVRPAYVPYVRLRSLRSRA